MSIVEEEEDLKHPELFIRKNYGMKRKIKISAFKYGISWSKAFVQ